MKTKKIIPLLALFILMLFLQGSCKKETDRCPTYKLPPATQTGANTFGCLVNDVVFVPRFGGLFAPKPIKFLYNEQTGELRFWIIFSANERDYQCGFPETDLDFSASEVFSTGKVEHGQYRAFVDYFPIQFDRGESYGYRNTLPNLNAKLEITKLDTVENIISGVFEFEASQDFPVINPEKILYVTEGRFDFRYNQDGSVVEGYSN